MLELLGVREGIGNGRVALSPPCSITLKLEFIELLVLGKIMLLSLLENSGVFEVTVAIIVVVKVNTTFEFCPFGVYVIVTS